MHLHGIAVLKCVLVLCITMYSTGYSSQTLVRTKRKPAQDDYDYIEDFQKDEAVHSSTVRIEREATENATSASSNSDIDNVFENIVDKTDPEDVKKSTITHPVTENPRNEIEKFFSDIATRNSVQISPEGQGKLLIQTNDNCNKTSGAECSTDLDSVFRTIIEKSPTKNTSSAEENDVETIDNVFSNLVQKARQPSQHVSKRNIHKTKDNSANNFEKLRKMFEVMNKRSVSEEEEDNAANGKVSGDESGSGRSEGTSGDVTSGSGMTSSTTEASAASGKSETANNDEETARDNSNNKNNNNNNIKMSNKQKRSLGDEDGEGVKNVKRYHRSFDVQDEPQPMAALRDHLPLRNPRSKILAKERHGFPDIPLPFMNEEKADAGGAGSASAALEVFYNDQQGNVKEMKQKRGLDTSLYPAFTKLVPFKEYKSLDVFKRSLGDEKFNTLQVVDEAKAQHLFDNGDGDFLKKIKRDGIYYDMQSKHFLISTEHMPPLNTSGYQNVFKSFVQKSDGKKENSDVKKSTIYFNETIDSKYAAEPITTQPDATKEVVAQHQPSVQTPKALKKIEKKRRDFISNKKGGPLINIIHINSSLVHKEKRSECDQPCVSDSLPTLSISKREILSDDDPLTDDIMAGLEEGARIKRAEKVYNFAKDVINVVANNTVITKKRSTDQNLLGIWSGLGTAPEFRTELVVNKNKRPSRKQKRSKDDEEQPEKMVRQKRRNGLVMMNGDNHHFYEASITKPKVEITTEVKRGLELAYGEHKNKHKSNKHKENVVSVITGNAHETLNNVHFQQVARTSDSKPSISEEKIELGAHQIEGATALPESNNLGKHTHIEQSESKQIEIGSLGSMNMVPRVNVNVVENTKVTPSTAVAAKKDAVKKSKKMKRDEQVPLNRKSARPVQDGRVVLAFDEVKELLPTKHFFKEDYKDDGFIMDQNDDRNSRSSIPYPGPPPANVDVDKELADSMMLAGDIESSPYKPEVRTPSPTGIEEEDTGRGGNDGNNIISMFNGHKKLKHTQVKYHDDETKGKYTQMKHWLEDDQAAAYQKEADTARKIQEVIDKLAKSDAELHRLTSTMKNETTASIKTPDGTTTETVGGAAVVDEKDKDERFKLLEKEIQEEHANYRKLVLQQQKQYEERLKAKAQLAKMQKEIDNLSLLHATNSSVLLENTLSENKLDEPGLDLLNSTDDAPALFSNNTMFTDLSTALNKTVIEPEVASPKSVTENVTSVSNTTETTTPTQATQVESTAVPTAAVPVTTTTTTTTATPTTTSAPTVATEKPTLMTTTTTSTSTQAPATTTKTPGTTSSSNVAAVQPTNAAPPTNVEVVTPTKEPTLNVTLPPSIENAPVDNKTVPIPETAAPASSAAAPQNTESGNPFEHYVHEIGYLKPDDIHYENETAKLAQMPVDDIGSSGIIQYITKSTPSPIDNVPTTSTTQSSTESLPPHGSFPFPLEIAYKPKIVAPSNQASRKPEMEPREDGYVGCYIDRLEQGRDLPVRAGIPLVTPHNCISSCKTTGYKYAGLQYGYLCFCGNAYGRYDIVPDSECNTVCSGNDSFTCGGLWRNEIFETVVKQVHVDDGIYNVNADVPYELDDPLYITKDKELNGLIPSAVKADVVHQRKSEIPTINDKITDAQNAGVGTDKGYTVGQELLNEIHQYAVSDLKALEMETQDAMSRSPSGIVRAIQNLTDDEILAKAKQQAALNPNLQKLFTPPESATELGQTNDKSKAPVLPQSSASAAATPATAESLQTPKSAVLLNYFNRGGIQDDETPKQSPELNVRIEPGTHLFRGEILLKQLWYDDLAKLESAKFKILAGNIEVALKNIFTSDNSFLKTEVMSLREAGRRVPHKTIADFSLTFYQNESAKVVTNKIFSTVKNGKLDEMPVYPQTLKIKEYIMDPNARAYIPNELHPAATLVDINAASRSSIPSGRKQTLYYTPGQALPSNSARAHIRPVHANAAQAKLRSYMSTQLDRPVATEAEAAQRSMIPQNPQKRNNNVPYVLRMFFWKDMLARRKRADRGEDRKEGEEELAGKPRRSIDEVLDTTNEMTVNRERRSQADTWPTAYKKDSQKKTHNNNDLTPNLLKRVKRVLPDVDEDPDTSKTFHNTLDDDFASLFEHEDEPPHLHSSSRSHENSKSHHHHNHRKTTLLGKMTDKNHNHDRLTKHHYKTTSHDSKNSQSNSTNSFR